MSSKEHYCGGTPTQGVENDKDTDAIAPINTMQTLIVVNNELERYFLSAFLILIPAVYITRALVEYLEQGGIPYTLIGAIKSGQRSQSPDIDTLRNLPITWRCSGALGLCYAAAILI